MFNYFFNLFVNVVVSKGCSFSGSYIKDFAIGVTYKKNNNYITLQWEYDSEYVRVVYNDQAWCVENKLELIKVLNILNNY